MIILFNVKVWLLYSIVLSGIIWLIMAFYDYVFSSGKKEDDFFDSPIAKREDVDNRVRIPEKEIEKIGMDSIIE